MSRKQSALAVKMRDTVYKEEEMFVSEWVIGFLGGCFFCTLLFIGFLYYVNQKK